jgi:hypothetical protein
MLLRRVTGIEDIDAPTFSRIEVYPHGWVPIRGDDAM